PRLAARFADEYVITMPSAEQIQTVRDRLDRACTAHGRDPSSVGLSIFAAICVAETEREVQQHLQTFEATNPQVPRMLDFRANWISGTPDQVQDQLAELDRAGIARLLLSVNCDLHREMLPLLAQQGTAALRD